MGPVQAVKHCVRNYRNFSGRASRSEFWWFLGMQQTCALIFGLIALALFGGEASFKIHPTTAFNLLSALPFAAVFTRRLHDVNWSGWWQLIYWAVFPLSYFKVTQRMLSGTMPSVVNWITVIVGLVYAIMFLVVIAQWFRKSKAPKTNAIKCEEPVIAKTYRIEKFNWQPSPKNEAYGRCP